MTSHPVPPLLDRTAKTRRAATAAVLVLLTIATRWLAAPFQRGSYQYRYDGLLDTCVKPWQFFTGQAVAGGDNCYLSFAMSYFASAAFGYSVEVLQAVGSQPRRRATASSFSRWSGCSVGRARYAPSSY